MEKIITRKKRVIKFTNTKMGRAGKGIETLRERANLSRKQLADEVGISENYLTLLEEGHELEVQREVFENIAQTVGVCKRGNALSDEQLINLFLYANKCDPPRLIE